jgi:NADPH:quinone reductase-like Zn-dependent oxidoreductase
MREAWPSVQNVHLDILNTAGGMGNALIDLAKAADLVVIGVVGGEEKSKFARNLGADHVIDRKAEKVGERVRQSTRDRGVDIIIDPVAGPTIPDRLAACSSSTARLAARRNTICSQRCA